MNNKILIGIFIYFIGGFCGALLVSKSWKGVVYFYNSTKDRVPSSIDRRHDFSNLQGIKLNQASKERLVSKVNIFEKKDSIGIELGHFVRRGPDGQKEFACSSLNKIKLLFVAVGVSESGRIPQLSLEAPCKPGKNLNRISAIWIPREQLLIEKPGDIELNFHGKNSVKIKSIDVGMEWPRKWVLKEIELFNSEDLKFFVKISSEELGAIRKGSSIFIEL